MKGDDREPPAGLQQPLGSIQAAGQFAKLVIDGDAERLKRLGRRIGLRSRPLTGRTADNLRCLARARQWARIYQRPRDLPRPPLLAIMKDDVGKVTLVRFIDDVGRRTAFLRHTHVERTVLAKGKAPLRPVELHRRHADVEHDRVDLARRVFAERRVHAREAFPMHFQPFVFLGAAGLYGVGVTVEGGDALRAPRQRRARITAGSVGAVDHMRALDRRNGGHDLLQEDRGVLRAHHLLRAFSSLRRMNFFSSGSSVCSRNRSGFQTWK